MLPSSETMKKYNPKIAYPIHSPGNSGNLRDIAMDNLEKHSVVIIEPPKNLSFVMTSTAILQTAMWMESSLIFRI